MIRAISLALYAAWAFPPRRISPLLNISNPGKQFVSVDMPLPFGPMIPERLFRGISTLDTVRPIVPSTIYNLIKSG